MLAVGRIPHPYTGIAIINIMETVGNH